VLPKSDEEIIAGIIQGGLSVKPLKNTKIVTITYADKNPAVAKLVADAVVQAYIDELLEIKLATSNYSLKWMNSKAAEERDKLEKSERDLQSYMRENDLVTVENKLTVLPQKLSEVGVQLSKAETEEKELQDLLEQINAVIDSPDRLETIQTFCRQRGIEGHPRADIQGESEYPGPVEEVRSEAPDDGQGQRRTADPEGGAPF